MKKTQNKKENYLQCIQEYLLKMPSLSTTITKVLSVCNNPNTSANDLNKVVSFDPVLTGNVLKLINSAYYSMRDRVTSLTQAIIMLGLNTIKNLALSTAVLGAVGGKTSSQNKSMDIFWTHCISTGVSSKAIALKAGVLKSECEEYFVAGLLHDIGKIPLIQCFPVDYMKVVSLAHEKNVLLHIAEKAVFGINHEETGKLIAEKWDLQGAVYPAICFHHHPSQADNDNLHIVERVALGDIFSNILVQESFDGAMAMPENAMLKGLLKKQDLTWSSLIGLQENILMEIENAKVFMQIAKS